MKKYNFVYKTVFNDGRYYFGQHKTDNLDDNYYGSSQIVKELVRNHPELEPKREIVQYCETQKELNKWEKYYIDNLYKTDQLCLNNSNICGITENVWMKGKHHTEESKNKNRDAHKGKHHTEETKQKMSESHKGENNSMYGKHHTEETKKKQSNIKKGENNGMYGKHHTEETKRNLSELHKGHKHTTEAKQKMSKSKKGKSTWNKGIPHTKETKRKMCESLKGDKNPIYGKHRVYDNPEHTKYHYE